MLCGAMFGLSFTLMTSSRPRTPASDQRGEMLVGVRQNHALDPRLTERQGVCNRRGNGRQRGGVLG
jgi:hypothetical protein